MHGKHGRSGVRSDWMDIERSRGISITSSVLRFEFGGALLNLLDTPGHADFSEDTYRVLAAVDGAVMLLDSAKGLEAQTLKLFDVSRHRGIPVITFVNKWDRPGREPLELLDEVEQRIGLRGPADLAGRRRGRLPRADRPVRRLLHPVPPHPGGATRATEERVPAERAAREEGDAWRTALEELELLDEIGAVLDLDAFREGVCTPVLFGAALPNFGVGALLDTVRRLAPAPSARADSGGTERPVSAPFSGQVFKVQAGMDRAHRDRLAFIRVCSGRFERGMCPHPRRHGTSAGDEVRADDVRPRPLDAGRRLPGRRDRAAQHVRPDRRRHPLRQVRGGVPADPGVRARALHGGARQGQRARQAVPARHRAARRRGRRAGAAATCAATRRRSSPRSGHQFEVVTARMDTEFGAPSS